MVIALLDKQEARRRDLRNLKLVSCGGSVVAPELVRRFHLILGSGFPIIYGQTENCPVIIPHHLSDRLDNIYNTAGQPVPQTAVAIRSIDKN